MYQREFPVHCQVLNLLQVQLRVHRHFLRVNRRDNLLPPLPVHLLVFQPANPVLHPLLNRPPSLHLYRRPNLLPSRLLTRVAFRHLNPQAFLPLSHRISHRAFLLDSHPIVLPHNHLGTLRCILPVNPPQVRLRFQLAFLQACLRDNQVVTHPPNRQVFHQHFPHATPLPSQHRCLRVLRLVSLQRNQQINQPQSQLVNPLRAHRFRQQNALAHHHLQCPQGNLLLTLLHPPLTNQLLVQQHVQVAFQVVNRQFSLLCVQHQLLQHVLQYSQVAAPLRNLPPFHL